MKEIKELKFEELTLEQKFGLVLTLNPFGYGYDGIHKKYEWVKEENEFLFELIKKRALGAVWIVPTMPHAEELMKKVKELADYPILIFTDAENGLGDYKIGKHNAVGRTDSEDLAYIFGKVTAITARKMGYNVICSPLLDMGNTGSERWLGNDKERVIALAAAEAEGLHDGGVLTVGKHYPGGNDVNNVDPHMAEAISDNTKEELLEYALCPYMTLNNKGLLDGIMTSHKRFINIDDKRPASLSKPVIDIFREQGFNGFALTDALCMMGIQAKFGDQKPNALCIESGNDLALPFFFRNADYYREIKESYEQGLLTEERLNEAVKRVLDAQHKTLEKPEFTELNQDDIDKFQSINKKATIAITDENTPVALPKDGKHFFVLMVDNGIKLGNNGTVNVDTFTDTWRDPVKMTNKLKELFPNSTIEAIYQFPEQQQMDNILSHTLGYENVIFITFAETLAYAGPAHLTRRIEALINAMQITNRISALIHFGVPTVLENLEHIPRIIFGGISEVGVNYAFEALAGEFEPSGKLTYDVKLK